MGVWIIFIIVSSISICIGLKKGVVKSGISFLGKVITFVISFGITRILVNSLSLKVGKEIAKFVKKEYGYNLFEIGTVEEFLKFITSIIFGIALFYIVYSIIAIIIIILKYIFFGDKDDSNLKLNPVVSKILISVFCVLSTALSFMMAITPVGIIYNSISGSISDKIPVFSGEKLPFVSEIYFNKLTEMPNNKNNIESTKEIKYTVNLIFASANIYQNGNNKNDVNEFKYNFEKSYFLPTVIAEVGSSAAKQWKNGDDYFELKFDVPEGREGELSLKFLDILEKWNKKTVVEDVNTLINLSSVITDYGKDKFTEENGLLNALANEKFTEELFVTLYSNDDFSQLVPAVIEYGLGTAFDSMNLEVNEEAIETINIVGTSEEDAKKQAKAISETIKTILKLQETAQKLNDTQLNQQDIDKIIEDLNELKEDEALGNVAEELIYQLNDIKDVSFVY